MPELAEVETVRNVLKDKILNKPIKNIDILYPKMIENDLNYFKNSLIGQSFLDIKRKGKYLILETSNHYLISHLRMEGKYYIKPISEKNEKHEHVIFYFDDFSLRYHDTRKFGRMRLINKDELNTYFKNVGPDANGDNIELNTIYNKIYDKNLPIKTLLLDQSIIAGLGNIYVDEVLFASNINPLEKGNNLTKDNISKIINNSRIILNKAIEYKGTTIRSYTSSLNVQGEYQQFLKVHKRNTCTCGCDIIKIRINGRATYYCPKCQRMNESK